MVQLGIVVSADYTTRPEAASDSGSESRRHSSYKAGLSVPSLRSMSMNATGQYGNCARLVCCEAQLGPGDS